MKIGGEIVQKPENTAPVIPVAALDAEPDSVFFQQLVKPFDLLSDTLYRAGIWYRENRTWLFLDIHHIICDGLSSAVLLNDLASVLKGGGTTQEAVTAYDYALYEKEQLADIETRLGEAYFEDMIRQAEPVVWPDSETTDGNARGIAEYTVARETIDAFCAAQAVTPGSFLQAAFALTLLKKRVAATPDAPAFIFHDKTLTYRELDDITSRLAVFLRHRAGGQCWCTHSPVGVDGGLSLRRHQDGSGLYAPGPTISDGSAFLHVRGRERPPYTVRGSAVGVKTA